MADYKLYNGDCLDIMPTLAAGSVDLVLTDIPYNISRDENRLRNLFYGEWDKSFDYKRAVDLVMGTDPEVIAIFCGYEQVSHIIKAMADSDRITRCLILQKTNPTVLNCSKVFTPTTELIAYGKKRAATFNSGYHQGVFIPKKDKVRYHPTQKALNVLCDLIRICTNEGDTVLDFTMGSGSTGVAAMRLNRNFIGIELDADYYAIAENRIKNANNEFVITPKEKATGQMPLWGKD